MFDLENSRAVQAAGEPSRHRLRVIVLRATVILALISLSVAFVLLCPCDLPFQRSAAIGLLSLSLVTCLAAATVLFRMQAFLPDSRPILRALASVGIVIAIRYVELILAINGIARLAERSH